jgi:hypothetical protein
MTWHTSSLPLAAYIVTLGALEFHEVEATDPTSAVFVFEDPQGRGPALGKEFSSGGQVSAIRYHEHLRRLRFAMKEALQKARSGRTEQFEYRRNNDVRQSFCQR